MLPRELLSWVMSIHVIVVTYEIITSTITANWACDQWVNLCLLYDLVPSNLDVLGTYLQFERHHGANAGRREEVWNRWWLLEGYHDASRELRHFDFQLMERWSLVSSSTFQLSLLFHYTPLPPPNQLFRSCRSLLSYHASHARTCLNIWQIEDVINLDF